MKKRFTILFCAFMIASCIGVRSGKKAGTVQAQSRTTAPIEYTYRIVNSHPHSTDSYTQGLIFHDGKLIEGTGVNGESRLMTVDINSGKSQTIASLDARHFGEGITLLRDTIYQLTWTTNRLFLYDIKSGNKIGEKVYAGEGWGITTDGDKLYTTDGSSVISVRNPHDFKVVRRFAVNLNNESVNYLNELEWINGKIWANVYTTNYIVIIDPTTGAVEGTIDLGGILPQEEVTPTTDVLNGIAYDAENERIFVTGKNWSRLFEIEIIEK